MATEASIKGEQAQQVLNNPAFIEAYDSVIDGLVDAIADAAVEDFELRNQLGLQLGAARAFKEQLFDIINTAQLEADEERRRREEQEKVSQITRKKA